MKKIIIFSMAVIFFLSLLAPSAYAGSKQRYRWQGVAIGAAAAILGHAIVSSNRHDSPPERVVVIDRDPQSRRYSNGHHREKWEIREIWVEPRCERVWNPGHYNEYNQWVSGQYIIIEMEPGYWVKERVRVGCR
jgi:hypothetical protein